MLEIHGELAARYRGLQTSRSGPVFFVEHGLSECEVADVFGSVSRHLIAHPLESSWWSNHRLPLLVACTEVGYRYRGSGTDFWPVLEDALGANISATGRQRIRDLFSGASKRYGGAHPPDTAWARAFHLIAWPITHALVPLEFHRPLARTLANLRVNVSELSNPDLHHAIRIAACSNSARFSTLLEDAALVVAVTRMLLGGSSSDFCAEIAERIAADIASDQVTRRAVAIARRNQRTIPKRREPPASPRGVPQSIIGSLRLRRRSSTMSLEAIFPSMEADLQTRLRQVLRRRRHRFRLWGTSMPVPSVQLLSCLPFSVKLTTAPPEDAELLPRLSQVNIDPELRDALAALRLDITHPLVFVVSPDEAHGRQIRGQTIDGNRKYWLLSKSGEGPPGCARLGEVGPYDCHLLAPAEDTEQKKALGNLGFQVRFGVSLGFAGSPPLERDAPTPVFVVGDQRVVVPRRTLREGLSVQLGNDEIRLTGDDLAIIVVEQGEHTLRVSNGDDKHDYTFRGTQSPPPAMPRPCSIEPRSADLTVQALLRGTLEFTVDSSASLEGLNLTVEIEASDQRLFASAPLGALPCSVSSEQEPFTALLDEETRRLLAQAQSPRLRLSVGGLCSRNMVLEQRVRPCWWQWTEHGTPELASEIGALPFGWIPATSPADTPTPASVKSFEETQLLAPIALDVSEHGDAAQFTTLCITPSEMQLEAPAARRPRLARRRRAGGEMLGLEEAVESYLRWSLAETPTKIAEIRRRQITEILDGWVTEICCGKEWVRREAGMGNMDPWEELVRICDETGFGRDRYVELSRGDEIEIAHIAVREIQSKLPDLWARVGSPCDLGPGDYKALDLACGYAYSELGRTYRERGTEDMAAQIEEGDPGAAPDEWDSVLCRVRSVLDLQPLGEMLIPSDLADGLMTLEPSMMTRNELTEELTTWAEEAERAFGGKMPQANILKAILALWIEPEAAVSLNWRGALEVLLAERSVARAARYLALRSRRAARRVDPR